MANTLANVADRLDRIMMEIGNTSRTLLEENCIVEGKELRAANAQLDIVYAKIIERMYRKDD